MPPGIPMLVYYKKVTPLVFDPPKSCRWCGLGAETVLAFLNQWAICWLTAAASSAERKPEWTPMIAIKRDSAKHYATKEGYRGREGEGEGKKTESEAQQGKKTKERFTQNTK